MSEALRHTTFRQLQIFLIAAEQRSFARAAALLHLTQPAVSMQMSQLTTSVGVPLFEKKGRQLFLTDAGEQLVPHVKRVAQAMRDASEAMEALQELRSGKVHIALVTTTRYFAPKLAAHFRRRHPGIELVLSIANRETVIVQLENNQIELAIMGRPPVQLKTVAEPFAQHPHVIIAAPGHPLAGKKNIAPKKLVHEVFISREADSGTRLAMENYFAAHAIHPPTTLEMTSNESIKQAVMAGMGLAFISLHTIGLEYQTGNLVLLDVKGLPVMRSWYLVSLTHTTLSPAALAFKEFVFEEAPAYLESLFPRSSKDVHSD